MVLKLGLGWSAAKFDWTHIRVGSLAHAFPPVRVHWCIRRGTFAIWRYRLNLGLLVVVVSMSGGKATLGDTELGEQFSKRIADALEPCLARLNAGIGESQRQDFRSTPERQLTLYHLSLGRFVRNSCLQGESVKVAFGAVDVSSPDELSMLVVRVLWRRLNSKPLELDRLIAEARIMQNSAIPPENLECPSHSGILMELRRQLLLDAAEADAPMVFAALCPADAVYWIHEHIVGWRQPTDNELKAVMYWEERPNRANRESDATSPEEQAD